MKHSALHSRRVVKFIGFGLAVMLAACVAAVPVRLAAQQPAPAASQPAAQSAEAAKPETAKAEEGHENDKFLFEGPLVKASARLFHLPVETTADIFLIINFAIIALAILLPLAKFMPRVFHKRKQTLRHDIDEARKVTAEANARLSAIESRLAGLSTEIAAIRTQVEQESLQDEAGIKASIEEERVRIVASAEQEISQAAAHAQRSLRSFAADLAITQAARQITLSAQSDQALIAEFTAELSGSPEGGQK